jgi:hypothetical protein
MKALAKIKAKQDSGELQAGQFDFRGYIELYTPSLIMLILVCLADVIFNYFAVLVVEKENHRSKQDYEESLTSKTFIFNFVNYYTITFMYAYWDRSFVLVASQMVVIMVGKNISINILEYVWYAVLTKRNMVKQTKQLDEKLSAENQSDTER